ncbi:MULTISPECIES: hypothetical protein [unclassified Paenibacillus]|uniref:hypothetical protein n=1 Tax=unclassified Paenibacillus TaxID=185978 RepID=UPI000A418114|nr:MULTISPECIES: hypothetical protein [unclassified Paenibacillus]
MAIHAIVAAEAAAATTTATTTTAAATATATAIAVKTLNKTNANAKSDTQAGRIGILLILRVKGRRLARLHVGKLQVLELISEVVHLHSSVKVF